MNRTLLKGARTLLIGTGLALKFWEQAVHHMNFIRNRVPNRNGVPVTVLKGDESKLETFLPFGAQVWFKLHGVRKLDPKAEVGVYLG
jgi:hypothetical protein